MAGSPGCYPVWYEDPIFHVAWYAADLKKHKLAIEYYRRSLANSKIDRNWVSWLHLGSVYHELGIFSDAEANYTKGLQEVKLDKHTQTSVVERTIQSVDILLKQVEAREPFAGKRIQYGIQLS